MDDWVDMGEYLDYKKKLMDYVISMDSKSVSKILNYFKDFEYRRYSDVELTHREIYEFVLVYFVYTYESYYSMVRHMPAGRECADFVFIPRQSGYVPLLIVDVDLDSSADAIVHKMVDVEHSRCLDQYGGKVILMGINFDSKEMKYSCKFKSVDQKPIRIF